MMTQEEDQKVIPFERGGVHHLIIERYFATVHTKCGKKGACGSHTNCANSNYERLVQDLEDVKDSSEKTLCDMCFSEDLGEWTQ